MRYFNKENPTKFLPSKSTQNFNYLKTLIWKFFFNLYRHFYLKQTHPTTAYTRIPKTPISFIQLPKLMRKLISKNPSQLRGPPKSQGKLKL